MSVVSIRLDNSDFKKGILALARKFPSAVRRSVQRAGTAARTTMVKEIGQDTGLAAKFVKERVPVQTIGNHTVRLEASETRLPLIQFKARGPEPSRGRGRGVSYRLPGGRGRAPHAFIATIRGRRGVFRRMTTERGPVEELHGPSLGRVFEKFLPLGAKRGREALVKNLRSEIAFAQSKR